MDDGHGSASPPPFSSQSLGLGLPKPRLSAPEGNRDRGEKNGNEEIAMCSSGLSPLYFVILYVRITHIPNQLGLLFSLTTPLSLSSFLAFVNLLFFWFCFYSHIITTHLSKFYPSLYPSSAEFCLLTHPSHLLFSTGGKPTVTPRFP